MRDFMIAPIREYLRRGIKVGLGTDSGGGYSSSMLDAMKQAFVVSIAQKTLTNGRDEPLSLAEGFYLATMGGAQVCGLEDKIGSFAVGKEFDALEIHTVDLEQRGVMSPVEEDDSTFVIFEKFLMTGDDRNIAKVYVQGRSVKV
jgi:guanine deaminase